MGLKFLTERYIQEGLHQYLEIEQPRAMLQIEQVVTQAAEHLIDRVRIPIVERGVRGNARTDLVEVTVTGITLHDLIDVELTLGTGTDKGHVAHEDIP